MSRSIFHWMGTWLTLVRALSEQQIDFWCSSNAKRDFNASAFHFKYSFAIRIPYQVYRASTHLKDKWIWAVVGNRTQTTTVGASVAKSCMHATREYSFRQLMNLTQIGGCENTLHVFHGFTEPCQLTYAPRSQLWKSIKWRDNSWRVNTIQLHTCGIVGQNNRKK